MTSNFFCEHCKFNCQYKSSWDTHISSNKHKNNGKCISNKNKEKIIHKCKICDFTGKHKEGILIHYLTKHGSIEEKEKDFKYYCKMCDFGSFYENIYNKHCDSKKHLTLIKYVNNT